MVNLSVNINKIATLRNARGGNVPDILKVAEDCQKFGADGITIHPRPDERHITKSDVFNLKPLVHKEYNIEGYPTILKCDKDGNKIEEYSGPRSADGLVEFLNK